MLMMSFLVDGYNFVFKELADPRTNNYILVSNPFKVLAIIFSYIYFVQNLGPKLMKNREPFHLKKIMIFYNILQILLNAFLFIEAWRYGWGWGVKPSFYTNGCLSMDWSTTPQAIYVFMVLRKRNKQISYLHVYHHSGMIALIWGGVRYFPGGHGTFLGFVNSFIHVIMYSYYLIALIRPPSKLGDIWWKKYLTILQMVQFVIVGLHQTLPAIIPNCDYPIIGAAILFPQTIYLLKLFYDFYKSAYNKNNSKKKIQSRTQNKFQ